MIRLELHGGHVVAVDPHLVTAIEFDPGSRVPNISRLPHVTIRSGAGVVCFESDDLFGHYISNDAEWLEKTRIRFEAISLRIAVAKTERALELAELEEPDELGLCRACGR